MTEALDGALVNLANSVRDYLIEEGLHNYKAADWVPCKSPIEHFFHCAIHLWGQIGDTFLAVVNRGPGDNTQLMVEFQAVVLDWPVDFLFTVRSEAGVVSQLIVECDGHDFHERTKEQAAKDRGRDRRLQEAGFTVYRFTGAEIYRNSLNCARQVYRWAEGAAWKK